MAYSVRPACVQDADQVNAIRVMPEVLPYMLALPTERRESTRALLQNPSNLEHHFVAVDDADGAVVAMASLHQMAAPRRRHVGELGIMVHPCAQGQGVGRRLMETLIDLADNWLRLDRLQLTVMSGNQRAHQLYRSLGFVDESHSRRFCLVDGALMDEHWMGRLRPGFDYAPAEDAPPESPAVAGTAVAGAAVAGTAVVDADGLYIRPRRREDSEQIVALQRQAGVFESLGVLPSLRDVQGSAWYDNLERYQNHAMVAVRKGSDEILGFVNLTVSANPRQRHMGEISLGVGAKWQNQGVGRQLLTAMLEVADKYMALSRIEMTVIPQNAPARALYRSMGFEEEGRIRAAVIYQGGYADEIVLARFR